MIDNTLPAGRPQPARPPARRPRLCFVAPEAWPVLSGDPDIAVVGGAEVQQALLARRLAAEGYPVSMICLDYGQPARTVVDGVTVIKAHRPGAGMPVLRFLHPRLTGLWRAMREADADIYYQRTAGMLTGVVAAFCQHYRRRSLFAGASDPDFVPGTQDIAYRRDRWLYEYGLANVDHLVVQNEAQWQNCLRHYGRRATLIPSCYALPPTARPGGGRTVLWVGNLRQSKQPALFLDLARRLPGHRFVMIGGPGHSADELADYERLRRAAADLPNFDFLGFQPLAAVEAHFDHAAVLVNTSRFEGMPNTFLQAWARGVPTVALIDAGARLDGGPLYPVAADTDALAAEVGRLMDDELHRRRLGRRCLGYFQRVHSVDGVVARYRAVFDRLAGEGDV